MKNFFKKINRIFQDYMREKRLKIGKAIWDKKEKTNIIKGNNFIEDNNIKSILFLRYDGKIGDMIVNSLMFHEIKKVYPDIKIGVVARGAAVDIIRENPNVDKIYEYYKDRKKIKDLALKIKEEKYDLLVDFSEMLRVNQMMLISLCGARFNIGLNRKEWKLFDLSIESGRDFKWTEHITKRYLAYLVKLGLKKENIDISYDIYLKDEKKYEDFFNEIKENKKSQNTEKVVMAVQTLIKGQEKISISPEYTKNSEKPESLKKFEKENHINTKPVQTITKSDLEKIYGIRKNEPGFYEAIDIVNEALEKDKK